MPAGGDASGVGVCRRHIPMRSHDARMWTVWLHSPVCRGFPTRWGTNVSPLNRRRSHYGRFFGSRRGSKPHLTVGAGGLLLFSYHPPNSGSCCVRLSGNCKTTKHPDRAEFPSSETRSGMFGLRDEMKWLIEIRSNWAQTGITGGLLMSSDTRNPAQYLLADRAALPSSPDTSSTKNLSKKKPYVRLLFKCPNGHTVKSVVVPTKGNTQLEVLPFSLCCDLCNWTGIKSGRNRVGFERVDGPVRVPKSQPTH